MRVQDDDAALQSKSIDERLNRIGQKIERAKQIVADIAARARAERVRAPETRNLVKELTHTQKENELVVDGSI